ncbi:methyltransferase regulatory domain-containing protein [Roseomonas sp. 573]|uniref:Methyltransferase regulatory domain-containing protein n=1 Tax=Roseomonas haemaphysalidis TaxID=2768162 RepID=A0ABS3KKT9_9PROT|nr:methyltransferase regulatory domain-containing protein [Roseomonas haemaphysalidis]
MVEAFHGIGCCYIGSAAPFDNIDAVCLPAATRRLLARARTITTAETMRDIARNQSFRRDLYRMGDEPLSPPAHASALATLVLAALPDAPVSGGLTFQTPIGPVEGEATLFDPLLKSLAHGPKSLAALAQATAAPLHPMLLNQATQMLIWRTWRIQRCSIRRLLNGFAP